MCIDLKHREGNQTDTTDSGESSDDDVDERWEFHSSDEEDKGSLVQKSVLATERLGNEKRVSEVETINVSLVERPKMTV
ncbi:hypothetical protein RYX36_019514 [Vicia faba]